METPFKEAKLVLGEPQATYYAGQLLTGHVECELKHQIDLKGVFVTFLGEAITEWHEYESEEYNGVRRPKKINYRGREEYFNVTQSLYGGTYVTQLAEGKHSLPFSFQIPHKVPSSFSGSHGRIRYCVSAFVDYADQSMERDILEKEIEVVVPFDLNSEEGKAPTGLDFEEVYSCCCSPNPMEIKISLPHAGYCPGQSIPVTIEAKNESNEEVKAIIFELVQRTGYRASQPYSEYIPPEEVIQRIKTGPILRKTTRQIKYEVPVPAMIAPNLDNCDIIDMGFALKVTIKMSGCQDDLNDECEVVLGLIPVAGSAGSENYKHPMADRLPTSPIPAPAPEGAQPPASNKHIEASKNSYNPTSTSYPQGYHNPNITSPYPNTTPYPDPASVPPPPYPGNPSSQPPGVGFLLPGAGAGGAPYPTGAPYPSSGPYPGPVPRSTTPEPSAPPLI